MKKLCFPLIFVLLLGLFGCAGQDSHPPILATTKPVYDFTAALCQGTGLAVGLLIDENISCLHDYSLSTTQMRQVERAQVVILSGAGLEAFPAQLLAGCGFLIDASGDVALLGCEEDHDHGEGHGHSHEYDPHIWLSPANAKMMAENICRGLVAKYPAHQTVLQQNLTQLLQRLDDLQHYGEAALGTLSCREIITFHDGFAYLAQAFDLEILAAVEEESGSEASAKELIGLIEIINRHHLPAIFNEVNGSPSAAGIIAAETNVSVHTLSMAMGEGDYFETMYQNINTLKEALE